MIVVVVAALRSEFKTNFPNEEKSPTPHASTANRNRVEGEVSLLLLLLSVDDEEEEEMVNVSSALYIILHSNNFVIISLAFVDINNDSSSSAILTLYLMNFLHASNNSFPVIVLGRFPKMIPPRS